MEIFQKLLRDEIGLIVDESSIDHTNDSFQKSPVLTAVCIIIYLSNVKSSYL